MKIGFYDSGLGGLSVLKSFLAEYGTNYDYFYYGDSARAPYGDKSNEELISYVLEIFQIMHEKEVDLVVSACNTSSALLNQIDLEDYFFQVISLADVVKDYFEKSLEAAVIRDFKLPVAFMATEASVQIARYKEWGVDIIPVACPKLVPLVEAGKLDEAKLEWQNYLSSLDTNVENVIIGCTHYSFLVDKLDTKYKFIDPAELSVKAFAASLFSDTLVGYKSDKDKKKLNLEIEFSKTNEEYFKLAERLLSYQ
jgi:glutamate racemase